MNADSKRITKSRRVAYARVSTDKQTTLQQVDALRAAGCEPIFVDDGVGACEKHRPALEKARNALKPGDVFVVWAIDRAFRSTIEALLFLDELVGRDVEFQSLTQQIDTRTLEGRKWFTDTASWAEYERGVISRRTREKMAAAKRRGQHLGRPFKLSRKRARNAYEMVFSHGAALEAVAAKYRVSPVTLTRAFKRFGLEAG